LDTNVLIEADRRHYPYKIATTFWLRLAEQVGVGKVVAPHRVYRELTENERHRDFVRKWVMVRRQQLSIRPDAEAQTIAGEISTYVFSNPQYDQYESWKFCEGGDPWVIAQAKVDGGTVVTQESTRYPQARKPRVPDVCDHSQFSVACVDTITMFKMLGLTF
jgi:hypothetical protein